MVASLWQSRREGLLAWALLLAMALVVFVLLLTPVLNKINSYRAELRKDQRMLQEFKAVHAARGELEGLLQEYSARDLSRWAYFNARPADVSLDIQRHVSGWLTRASAEVRSISALGSREQDGYIEVGVRVDFTAGSEALSEVLQAIEQALPLLMIDNLRVTPMQVRVRRGQQAQQILNVQMNVLTHVVAGGDT